MLLSVRASSPYNYLTCLVLSFMLSLITLQREITRASGQHRRPIAPVETLPFVLHLTGIISILHRNPFVTQKPEMDRVRKATLRAISSLTTRRKICLLLLRMIFLVLAEYLRCLQHWVRIVAYCHSALAEVDISYRRGHIRIF